MIKGRVGARQQICKLTDTREGGRELVDKARNINQQRVAMRASKTIGHSPGASPSRTFWTIIVVNRRSRQGL